jgi:hypothetical protein
MGFRAAEPLPPGCYRAVMHAAFAVDNLRPISWICGFEKGTGRRMNLQDLGNLGEFVGAIAVIVSVLYLAVQIRQNTNSVKTAAYEHVALSAMEINARLAQDADLSRIHSVGLRDPNELSPEDRMRFSNLHYAIFGNFEFIFEQHARGVVDDDSWNRWLGTIRGYIALPGGRAWWEAKPAPFSPRFTRFVETEVLPAELDAAQMAKFGAFLQGSSPDEQRGPGEAV